jgi:hypothetical protein
MDFSICHTDCSSDYVDTEYGGLLKVVGPFQFLGILTILKIILHGAINELLSCTP